MIQAKLWCPVQGGAVWVRSDWAHEFYATGEFVPVRFFRVVADGLDRPAHGKSEISDIETTSGKSEISDIETEFRRVGNDF